MNDTMQLRSSSPGSAVKVMAGLLVLLMAFMLPAIASPGSTVPGAAARADALSVRPGARWYQVDVLLTSAETRSAASGPRQAVFACAPAIASAAPVPGLSAYVGAVCVSMVTVCSARAVAVGRRAGVTFEPHRAWCWTY